MEDYLKRILDVSLYRVEECRILQQSFNKNFVKAEAYVELENNEMTFYLRRIDMKKYYSFVFALTVDEALKKASYDIVNKIGSYAVKGNKRIFVGYKEERKVSNRKEKEKNRGKHYYANNNTFSKENNELPTLYYI